MTDQQAEDILQALDRKHAAQRQDLLDQGMPTHCLDLDIELTPWLVAKVRAGEVYAQNLYAAMCNNVWQEQAMWEILRDETWRCTWRSAGSIVARIRGSGDYMDWYCSGTLQGNQTGFVGEGYITDEVRQDLAQIGWRPIDDD